MILLFTLLCLHPTTSSATPTNETSRLALLKFKESITNDPAGVLSLWNYSIQFCNWYGITWHHQRVTTLALQGHKLRGTITPYIGNLTFLTAINLQDNSFYGEIPKEVGHLFRLRHFNLSNNTLGGEIPTSLTNCSELKVIGLSRNKLIGKIPMELGSLSKLLYFLVAENNLTERIPSFLGNLSFLELFSATFNNLRGKYSKEHRSFEKLIIFRSWIQYAERYGPILFLQFIIYERIRI